jgi:hypothetical protein
MEKLGEYAKFIWYVLCKIYKSKFHLPLPKVAPNKAIPSFLHAGPNPSVSARPSNLVVLSALQ